MVIVSTQMADRTLSYARLQSLVIFRHHVLVKKILHCILSLKKHEENKIFFLYLEIVSICNTQEGDKLLNFSEESIKIIIIEDTHTYACEFCTCIIY